MRVVSNFYLQSDLILRLVLEQRSSNVAAYQLKNRYVGEVRWTENWPMNDVNQGLRTHTSVFVTLSANQSIS